MQFKGLCETLAINNALKYLSIPTWLCYMQHAESWLL